MNTSDTDQEDPPKADEWPKLEIVVDNKPYDSRISDRIKEAISALEGTAILKNAFSDSLVAATQATNKMSSLRQALNDANKVYKNYVEEMNDDIEQETKKFAYVTDWKYVGARVPRTVIIDDAFYYSEDGAAPFIGVDKAIAEPKDPPAPRNIFTEFEL